MEKIAIIGAGELGNALKIILDRKKDYHLDLWDRNLKKVLGCKNLQDIVPEADFLFLCVPSWGLREVIGNILPHLDKKTIVVSFAKGIEEETLKTADEIMEELFVGNQAYCLISGPMLAEELVLGLAGFGIAASKNKKAAGEVSDIFDGTNLRLEYSADLRGVAIAGVLKNIYAIVLGIADGLKLGDNTKGLIAAMAAGEMAEIIRIFGGKKETIFSSAGIGDLVATGFSKYSRNHLVGDELIRTGKCNIKSEGVVSLPLICGLLDKKTGDFKLLNSLNGIIAGNKKAADIFGFFKKK